MDLTINTQCKAVRLRERKRRLEMRHVHSRRANPRMWGKGSQLKGLCHHQTASLKHNCKMPLPCPPYFCSGLIVGKEIESSNITAYLKRLFFPPTRAKEATILGKGLQQKPEADGKNNEGRTTVTYRVDQRVWRPGDSSSFGCGFILARWLKQKTLIGERLKESVKRSSRCVQRLSEWEWSEREKYVVCLSCTFSSCLEASSWFLGGGKRLVGGKKEWEEGWIFLLRVQVPQRPRRGMHLGKWTQARGGRYLFTRWAGSRGMEPV